MSSERGRSSGAEDSRAPGGGAVEPLWRRAGKWAAAHAGKLALAVVTAAVVAIIAPMIVSAWTAVTTTGEPVLVRVALEDASEDVVLPPGSVLTEAELNDLAALPEDMQATWLEQSKDGVIVGPRRVVLTLRGNRPHLVRVADLRAVAQCVAAPRGALMRLADGRGASPESLVAVIDLDDPTEAQEYDPESNEMRSFFPEKTITLQEDEEEMLLVDLNPRHEVGILCEVRLELTVFDGDTEFTQELLHDGEEFRILQWEPAGVEAGYSAVYLGGMICREYVVAIAGWEQNVPAACGPGNRQR